MSPTLTVLETHEVMTTRLHSGLPDMSMIVCVRADPLVLLDALQDTSGAFDGGSDDFLRIIGFAMEGTIKRSEKVPHQLPTWRCVRPRPLP